jgi:hypothetical protein
LTRPVSLPNCLPQCSFSATVTEEAPKYTIVGSVIYIKSDYWANGAWTRKVNIADLDVPATLKENQSRGTHFTLPSRPGEVMMRP